VLQLLHTIGDPLGIGPELTAKWLQHPPHNVVVHVFGDWAMVQTTAQALGLPLPSPSDTLHVYDTGTVLNNQSMSGRIAYDAIVQAVKWLANYCEQLAVLVTGPINKQRLWEAGVTYSGHTELLESLANQYWPPQKHYQADMWFEYQQFRMMLLSRHVPLHLVSSVLTVEGVYKALQAVVTHLQRYHGLAYPKVAVLGVNPHASEIDGTEERTILQPAITAINKAYGLSIAPPLPADAVFRGFNVIQPAYDAYVASYHDQGLIPMKLLGGLQAVNVTIGLPFIRTSVSHGTADDIVGLGVADLGSLQAAATCAIHYAQSNQSFV
jgi:4-hydroxy-L-threonine phosphate dehydrogenase PdxA